MTVENLSRRQLLRGKFLTSMHTETEQKQGFEGIRPPWAMENSHFMEQCTRCGDCLSVCETKILVKGDGGFPEVKFDHGECTFCGKCVEVCEQPIFRSRETQPWTHKIEMSAACFRLQMGGVAQPLVNMDTCNGCGACLKNCPVNAIKISYLKHNE